MGSDEGEGGRIEIRLLGPLEVARGERAVEISSPQQRALLVVLALAPNRVVGVEEIVDALWGDEPPPSATRTVHSLVSRLRHVLNSDHQGDGATLVTREPGYVLRVDPASVDAARFATLVAAGRAAVAAGDPEAAVGALREGLGLWRGPALADLARYPFACREAARLDDARLAVTDDLAELELARRRPADALRLVESVIAAHPLREHSTALMMLALYRLGRPADALRAYQSLRRALGDLGLEPTPELRRLELRIIRHAADLTDVPAEDRAPAPIGRSAGTDGSNGATSSLPAVPLPAEVAVGGTLPFVGRAYELGRVGRFVADPDRRRAGVAWILGEPGIGKTRLANQIARWAHGSGSVVLFGRCSEDVSVPYQPLMEALRWFAAGLDDDELIPRLGALPGELVRLLPELEARLAGHGIGPSTSTSPETQQLHLFEAVRSWLGALGRERPVVALIDDAHWAAGPTLAMLGHIARNPAECRVAFVCTARSTAPDASAALSALAGELDQAGAPTERVELGGLALHEVAELVGRADGEDGQLAGDALAVELHRETSGNPLFVAGLLSVLAAGEAWLPGELPRSVAETVRRRVGRLPGDVGEVLRVAAVIGLDFDTRVTARALGRDDDEVIETLDLAAEGGLVEEVGPDHHRFVHALVRLALRQDLSRSREARVHERVARALEALHPDRLDDFCERLAHHYTQTSNAEKALEYLERANRKAIAANAVGEAAAYFGQAMELLDQMPDTTEHQHRRVSLLVAQFNVFFLLHRPADYFELLRRYEALVNEVGDPSLVAVFYTHMGQSLMIFGDGAQSLETLHRAVAASEASGELATYGMACTLIGCQHMWLANYDDILPWMEKAYRVFEEQFNLPYYKWARTHHSWSYAQRGRWREAVEESEASLLAGYEHHDDSVVSFSAAVLAWAYAAWGRTERAAELAELAVGKAPTPADQVWSQTFGGFAWCRAGKVQRAIDTLAGLGPLYEAAGFTYGWIMNQTYLGEAYWLGGQLDDARRVLEAATARAEPIGMRFFYGWGERLLGEVLADELGEPTERDRAAGHLTRAIAVLGEIGAENELALAHAAYGRLCDRRGQAGPAGEHLVRARAIFERLGTR